MDENCWLVLILSVTVLPAISEGLGEITLPVAIALPSRNSTVDQSLRGVADKALKDIDNAKNMLSGLAGYKMEAHYIDTSPAVDRKSVQGATAKAVVQQLDKKRMVGVIGAMPPRVSVTLGQITTAYNLFTITSNEMSTTFEDRQTFPYIVNTRQPLQYVRPVILKFLDLFYWRRVALLGHPHEPYASSRDYFEKELKVRNITISVSMDIRNAPSANYAVSKLKEADARIIIVYAPANTILHLMCQAYKSKLYGPKYVWIVVSWQYKSLYSIRPDNSLICEPSEAMLALDGAFSVWYPAMGDKNTLYGLTPSDILLTMGAKSSPISLLSLYDSVWSMAVTLNWTLPLFRTSLVTAVLNDAKYKNVKLSDGLVIGAERVSFEGATGPVSYDGKGTRLGLFRLYNIRNGSFVPVATYTQTTRAFQWSELQPRIWYKHGGKAPRDGDLIVVYREYIPNPLMVAYVVLSLCSTLAGIVYIAITIYHVGGSAVSYRWPVCSCMSVVGGLLININALLQTMDVDKQGWSRVDLHCKIGLFLLVLGFTLFYDSLVLKMCGMYQLCMAYNQMESQGLRNNKKSVSEYGLMGVLLVFVLVDLLVLVPWTVTDPVSLVAGKQDMVDESQQIIYRHVVSSCESRPCSYWLMVLLCTKSLLLIFGTFLIWPVRQVTRSFAGLNDIKYVGPAVVVILLACMAAVPVSFLVHSSTVKFAVVGGCQIGATLITFSLLLMCQVNAL